MLLFEIITILGDHQRCHSEHDKIEPCSCNVSLPRETQAIRRSVRMYDKTFKIRISESNDQDMEAERGEHFM